MDQIKQSHCSESSKSRDLEIIKSLAGSLDLIGDYIPERILEISQASDSHLGKIWDSLRGTANAGNEFPYYLLKNNILYRRYMQVPGKEKHVICLPDELLPAVIHSCMLTMPTQPLLRQEEFFVIPITIGMTVGS